MKIKFEITKNEEFDGNRSLTFIGKADGVYYTSQLFLKLTPEQAADMRVGQTFELIPVETAVAA